MNRLILLPGVFDDVAHAAQWYDEEGGQGLGDRFVACFYAYLRILSVRAKFTERSIRISGGCFLNRFHTHFTTDAAPARSSCHW